MPYLPLDLEGHALRLFRRPLLLGRISPTSFSLWLFGLRVRVWEGVKFHATLKGFFLTDPNALFGFVLVEGEVGSTPVAGGLKGKVRICWEIRIPLSTFGDEIGLDAVCHELDRSRGRGSGGAVVKGRPPWCGVEIVFSLILSSKVESEKIKKNLTCVHVRRYVQELDKTR